MKRLAISATALLLMLLFSFALASPALAEGQVPVAQNLELTTYRNVSVGGTLSAYDPDDDIVSFEITTKPVKGDIVLQEDGSFVYTPRKGKKGRDYFGYRATDAAGNVSQEATAQIRIEKQSKTLRYQDMSGRGGEYAAITLMEKGIFTGERIGGQLCFCPDRAITRGEFMDLAMQITGKPLLKSVMQSAFADDADMDERTRALAATAAMEGICSVRESFDAEEAISQEEAASVLNDVLGLEDAVTEVDDPAVQACMNLEAVGILGSADAGYEHLTREKAAVMLVKAMETLAARS